MIALLYKKKLLLLFIIIVSDIKSSCAKAVQKKQVVYIDSRLTPAGHAEHLRTGQHPQRRAYHTKQ